MPHRCRRRGEFAPRSCCRCYGLTTRVSHRLSAMPRSRGVEVVPVSGGFCVDGTHLPDSVVQRSGLLLELCASCTGSATIPIRKETFRLWSRYAHGSAPWDDLVKIMEVRPENQLTGRRCVPVCSRHLDGSAHYARLLRKWCYARFFCAGFILSSRSGFNRSGSPAVYRASPRSPADDLQRNRSRQNRRHPQVSG